MKIIAIFVVATALGAGPTRLVVNQVIAPKPV
jgi:hypothetical protein